MPIPTVGFCVFAITYGTKSLSGTPTVPWVLAFLLLPTVHRQSRVPLVFAFLPLPTVENRCQARRPYRGFLHFCRYPRYKIAVRSLGHTVGFRVFAVTHGMKLSCPRRFLPWVFAFLPLPTVQNRCQARRPYRGFLHFCYYQRYAAGRAYRRFSRFRHYPRYEIELSMPIPTVGFRIFAVTHGRKSLSGTSTIPLVFAF